MSLVEELRKAYRLRGETYSSNEVFGLLNRAAAEIERIISLDNRVLKERKDRIDELEAAVKQLGEMGCVCTFDTLKVICDGCRCDRRKPSRELRGGQFHKDLP